MRAASRIAIVGVVGSLAAACSTDSTRFAETPFSNPFGSSGAPDPAMTGSIDEPGPSPARSGRMPRDTIRSEPIAPVRSAETSSPAPRIAATGSPGWSSAGGASITVGPGDTLATISNRYGVPSTAILSANGMTASQVTPGRRIVIPVYSASGGAASGGRTAEASPSPAGRVVSSSKIAPIKAASPRTMAEAAETKPRVRPGQARAEAARADAGKGDGARGDGTRTASRSTIDAKNPVRAAPPAAKVAAPAKVPAQEPAPKPAKVSAAKPAEPVKVAPQAAKIAAVEPAKAAAKEPEATGAIPATTGGDFRWPARGRVITGFGGGGSNEGINIAVPDGTPVKAAGDGVVAYAGSEVKGYGNLVLIRHDNGYVSAYAHNGDLDVKRGQKVARGQTIAKSGQSGNVTSPQLHFEIRKGSTPVDPMKYLASAN